MTNRTVQPIRQQLLDELLRQARQYPRRRAIRRLHDDDWEHAHRMLNALTPGTYVQPHRHADRYKGEGFILLRGQLAVLIFHADGTVDWTQSCLLALETGSVGLDIPPGVWHSLVALADTVIYEVKGQPAGGYVQETDKDFAPWAPAEGTTEAGAYLCKLEAWARNLLPPISCVSKEN